MPSRQKEIVSSWRVRFWGGWGCAYHMGSPAQLSAPRSPATPLASLQVSAGAPGDDGKQSEGDAMEVCSEHTLPPAEPSGERRACSRRSVADSSEALDVENCGFGPGRSWRCSSVGFSGRRKPAVSSS